MHFNWLYCLWIPTHTFVLGSISPTPYSIKHPYFQPSSQDARESCQTLEEVAVAIGERIVDNITDITPADFANPWNFFYLFTQSEEDVYFWCRQNGLLATSFPCHVDNCTGEMALAALSRAPGGAIFRCTVNRRHTKSSRSHSFIDKSNLVLQDIILFIKSYLEKNSLAQCARFTGMAYRSTAVNWASFMREVFKEYFNNTLRNVKLQGIVEIDESLFGRRVKYHKGNPNRGLKAS